MVQKRTCSTVKSTHLHSGGDGYVVFADIANISLIRQSATSRPGITSTIEKKRGRKVQVKLEYEEHKQNYYFK